MRVQLQSILLPTEEICKIPELYYHENDNRVDFDGYFNLFYIEKRKVYTNISGVYLVLRAVGYSRLLLMHESQEIMEVELENTKDEYMIKLPYEQYSDGVFWFSLTKRSGSASAVISGYFAGEISENHVRTVNIGIDICTFQRESYVFRNLKRLKNRIMDNSTLDAAEHVRIYVIDNGKTLKNHIKITELAEESDGRICIYENRNAGGAGGFTRGMLEILREKEQYSLTHVLLMDDDAVIEPDAVVRTYGLLATLKEEWKDITVGGGMMREELPHILRSAGEKWKDGYVVQPQRDLDVREFAQAAHNYLTKTGYEAKWYSGWWYCCFSLNVVRRDNLPLPLFIHEDDIEFGLRNKAYGVVFLNGVIVWHKSFEKFFPGANLYYDIRNVLITLAVAQNGDRRAAWIFLTKSFAAALFRMRYQDADIIYRGLIDFIRGPQWLEQQSPEKLNVKIRAMAVKLRSLTELNDKISADERVQLQKQMEEGESKFFDILVGKFSPVYIKLPLRYITLNGGLLIADKHIIAVAVAEPIWKAYRKKKVFWYEIESKKGILAEKSYKKMFHVIKLYIKANILFGKYFGRACIGYRKRFSAITNQEFWQKYLYEA